MNKAMQRMALKRVGLLVVVDNAGCFVGVLEARQMLFAIAKYTKDKKPWESLPVGENMEPASKVICVLATDTATMCLSILAKTGVKAVPVVDEAQGLVVGVLSCTPTRAHTYIPQLILNLHAHHERMNPSAHTS